MKIIYPNHFATEEQVKAWLTIAMEGRKRVKDQLLRIDDTATPVEFVFSDMQNREIQVKKLEQQEFSSLYCRCSIETNLDDGLSVENDTEANSDRSKFKLKVSPN